jgi:hypothetical protein
MNRRTVLFLLSFVVLYSILLTLVYLGIARPHNRSAEEQQIYSILRDQDVGFAGSYVFEADTVPGIQLTQDAIDYVQQNLPGLSMDALGDFQDINSQTYSLSALLPVTKQDIFLTKSESSPRLDYGQWDGFYEKYPHAFGIIGVSRVGFNSTYTQALVYVERFAAVKGGIPFPTSGAGFLVKFGRVFGIGKWIDQGELVVSITG